MATVPHTGMTLLEDEIDDVLYCARANEKEELDQTLSALQNKYSLSNVDVLARSIDGPSGNTALHYAAANGHAVIVSSILGILSSKADLVNTRNMAGSTPLHWAALNGHMGVTKLLVEAKADMWIRNNAGNLAVFEAERAGKDDIVAYLLLQGGTEKEREGTTDAPANAATGVSGADEEEEEEEIVLRAGEVDDAADAMAHTNITG